MKTNLIKKIFFVTYMLMGVLNIQAQVRDSIDVPILDGGEEPVVPPREPMFYNVCGFVDTTNSSICFIVSTQIIIEHVWIRRNGILVVSDDAPVLIGNILCYNLSTFGSGAYLVELYADDQNVYIGQFNL